MSLKDEVETRIKSGEVGPEETEQLTRWLIRKGYVSNQATLHESIQGVINQLNDQTDEYERQIMEEMPEFLKGIEVIVRFKGLSQNKVRFYSSWHVDPTPTWHTRFGFLEGEVDPCEDIVKETVGDIADRVLYSLLYTAEQGVMSEPFDIEPPASFIRDVMGVEWEERFRKEYRQANGPEERPSRTWTLPRISDFWRR